MKPLMSERNLTPTSIALGSEVEVTPGTVALLQMEMGPWTETEMPAFGVSMLPLSSTARLRMIAVPFWFGDQVYVQLNRPTAGCQVPPPSTETSTPATVPPPASL